MDNSLVIYIMLRGYPYENISPISSRNISALPHSSLALLEQPHATRSIGELILHHPQPTCNPCTPVKFQHTASIGSRVLRILVSQTCINLHVIRRAPARTIESQSTTSSDSKASRGEPCGAQSGHKHRHLARQIGVRR
jgi:hypothetical protein